MKEREEVVSETQGENVDSDNTDKDSTNYDNFTEEEYKNACKEVFYEELFFGETDLEGKLIKIHLFLSEKYYFTVDDMSSDTLRQYNEKYNLNRDFYKCCVLREGTNSYVGSQINMWFSNNNSLDPNSYKTGQKITVYAEVIGWSNNTWEGFNSVTIIPKYIESNKRFYGGTHEGCLFCAHF